jgi:glycosyltransferase involved in cell wall biosynthesis
VVFTGGLSLQDAKQGAHPNVRCFPSSIEMEVFAKARQPQAEPAAQAGIPTPRVGFFGVIDERMDLALVAEVAAAAPDLQFVMLGPVVKIDPATLPQAANIHWLGQQSYADLPKFMAHWQAGWMPFALNEATRFISPTKTPEFLAAGLPLASTAVPDVVRTYGEAGFVTIADASTMVGALRGLLKPRNPREQARIDAFLARGSWDRTWAGMAGHIREAGLATKGKRARLPESKVL